LDAGGSRLFIDAFSVERAESETVAMAHDRTRAVASGPYCSS
jgi:hypothetical protein